LNFSADFVASAFTDCFNCILSSSAERLTSLLPEEGKQQAVNLLPAHDFEVAYRLDCRNLCADFQEDIEFKFSLGITALMNRFLGPRGTKSVLMGYSDRV
jgi:mitofusin